jgi:hypothetical protein
MRASLETTCFPSLFVWAAIANENQLSKRHPREPVPPDHGPTRLSAFGFGVALRHDGFDLLRRHANFNLWQESVNQHRKKWLFFSESNRSETEENENGVFYFCLPINIDHPRQGRNPKFKFGRCSPLDELACSLLASSLVATLIVFGNLRDNLGLDDPAENEE